MGCEHPTQGAVWGDDEDDFYSCPFQFLHESVVDWYEEYSYCKAMGGAPRYCDAPASWVDAMQTYERYIRKYSARPRDIGKRDQLAQMRENFRAQKNKSNR